MSNVNRLPDCYRKDPVGNNFKLLEINQQATKELKEDIQVLQEVLNLNSACGKSLDLYGGALGRQRGGMTDGQYRYALYAQIGRNNATGDYESIIGALVMMFGLEMGQITPKDFELTEDRERCLVRLKKYPEVLEEAGFEIREIYQMIKYLLPVCVPLLIQFYYWYNVLIRYDNTLRIFTEFYPRYNLAYHYWEGGHLLGGGKYLNGYDADTLVDFYPVVQAISTGVLSGVKVDPILCSTAGICCKTAMDAENTVVAEVLTGAGLSTGVWIVGDVEACHEDSAGVRFYSAATMPAVTDGKCVYCRAEAVVTPKAAGSETICSSYPVSPGYQNGLVVEKNLRFLEGMRTLAGTGLLNADIFNYTL